MKKKVLFLVNHDLVIYNFRLEIVEAMLKKGYEVHISSPYGDRIDELTKIGAIFHDIKINRHGINPIKEIAILSNYKKLLKEIKPDIIFGFTIKPNIYGAIASRKHRIPFVANITGLGTATENVGITQKIIISMYKYAFRDVEKVFFQNESNQNFFLEHNIIKGNYDLLPGSGVNLERYPYREYPKGKTIKFAFISRIMKEKGIDYYLEAAEKIKKEYPNTEFHICGFCEQDYEDKLKEYQGKGIIIYHGMIKDVAGFMAKMHCIVHPTYYPEGMSNVLLEACATGRPIITTNIPGCKEIVNDNVNGFIIQKENVEELEQKIKKFILLKQSARIKLGSQARQTVENSFDRKIVIKKYMELLT
ncbi:glycosyltransferase family 4 protein [Candidatus Saccharibacteria bacterium]|nr:glycosyltransferase family 4 protein [Candidatus Saccharibacteria bacterium]